MANPYAQRWDKYRPDWKKVEGKKLKGEGQARERADWLGLGSQVAPVAGTLGGALIGGLAGGPGGAMAGAGLGGALGGAVGTGMAGAADQQTRKYDEAEAKKRARYEAVAALLGQM